MKLCVKKTIWGAGIDATSLYERIYGEDAGSFLLESGVPGSVNCRYSILGSFGNHVVRFNENQLTVIRNGKKSVLKSDPLAYIDSLVASSLEVQEDFFTGGLVGFFAYEAVELFENISLTQKKGGGAPQIYLGETDEVVVVDHVESRICIYVYYNEPEGETDAQKRAFSLEQLAASQEPVVREFFFAASNLSASLTSGEFETIVRKTKEYIREGDIFQANLSQRFEADFQGSPWGFYKKLKKRNPSPFQGYINFGELQIISGSPERLVHVNGNSIDTRPIAGTRPRGLSRQEDERMSRELIVSEKERAEHLMLVDLERNDLGRICTYGSVRVEEFMALESYSHVWHIVSKISGVVNGGVTPMEVLKACFPGGTITGCPKVRCMEIIEELEPVSRGMYTGSMGYIGWGGIMDLNILIRSAMVFRNKISFNTGAGIVADSLPDAEYKETITKAQAIFDVLGFSVL